MKLSRPLPQLVIYCEIPFVCSLEENHTLYSQTMENYIFFQWTDHRYRQTIQCFNVWSCSWKLHLLSPNQKYPNREISDSIWVQTRNIQIEKYLTQNTKDYFLFTEWLATTDGMNAQSTCISARTVLYQDLMTIMLHCGSMKSVPIDVAGQTVSNKWF